MARFLRSWTDGKPRNLRELILGYQCFVSLALTEHFCNTVDAVYFTVNVAHEEAAYLRKDPSLHGTIFVF